MKLLEATACAEALVVAEDCGIHKIKVASDCLNVINNIMENSICSYTMILRDMKKEKKFFIISLRMKVGMLRWRLVI